MTDMRKFPFLVNNRIRDILRTDLKKNRGREERGKRSRHGRSGGRARHGGDLEFAVRGSMFCGIITVRKFLFLVNNCIDNTP